MLDREPFLKAIFADPDNDLPRLVFADYLEERGEAAWAELIRVSCERARLSLPNPPPACAADLDRKSLLVKRENELRDAVFPGVPPWVKRVHRGFLVAYRDSDARIAVTADELDESEQFRRRVIRENPEWYGATRLKVVSGKIVLPAQVGALLASPVTAHVAELDLSGGEVESAVTVFESGNDDGRTVIDTELRPVITVPMVELLAQSRDARRLTELDLTNNDLDNDAARTIARSPHLFRLRRLAFSRGNRFHGRVWQQLVERFGEHMVE